MKGVILAAGSGSRMQDRHKQGSKVLLTVGVSAVIDYTLNAFAQSRVTDLAVVVGYQAAAVERWIGDGSRFGLRVQYVRNTDFQLGNAVSLYVARSFVEDGPFILSMADHMVSSELVSRIVDFPESGDVLGVDFDPTPREVEEGTRVMVKSGVVERIGKGLNDWNGIDAGVFRLTPAVFEAVEEIMATERPEYQLSQALLRMLVSGHTLFACDVSGCFWQDIDTWKDLDEVRKAVTG